jgi:hypothetical protein
VVNTGRWSEGTVPELVVSAAESYDPGEDEGTFPVEGVRYEL